MSSGRLFQSFGPAEANERSPTRDLFQATDHVTDGTGRLTTANRSLVSIRVGTAIGLLRISKRMGHMRSLWLGDMSDPWKHASPLYIS